MYVQDAYAAAKLRELKSPSNIPTEIKREPIRFSFFMRRHLHGSRQPIVKLFCGSERIIKLFLQSVILSVYGGYHFIVSAKIIRMKDL